MSSDERIYSDMNNTSEGKPRERNMGLDLLRMVCMYMVAILHVLSQGGVMARIPTAPGAYYASWFLETCAFCAVNCYGLLSGYVGVHGKFKPWRIVRLWLTVFFYTVLITAAASLFHGSWVTREVLIMSLLPVSWKTYWYFSCYFVLFFFTPFLNRMVLSLEDREKKRLMLAIFVLLTLLPVVPKTFSVDTLTLLGGYSLIWLMALYVFGACLSTCSPIHLKKRWYLLIYLGCVVLTWGSKILIENYTRPIYGEAKYGRILTAYTSPTIFICGICLLLLFEQIQIRSALLKKIIRLFSPLAFSVYIIHAHPVIWEHLLKGAFKSWRYLPAWQVLWPVLLAALLIYVVCSLIDFLRRLLFTKIGIQ